MTATASVSSPWIPEDDLLLKNSIEGGASLEALAKGAVKFSRRFTLRELRDRWYSLLYDPDVSAQASARMAELEQSGSNPLSKFRLDNLKGSEKVPKKRKSVSIRKQYYAMQKKLKNEFFTSTNLGFFEERNLHNFSQQENTTNHEAPGGDGILDDCLANNLGFEEKDFEILRRAFPESIGTIATTTTVVVDNPANNFINGSDREDDLYKFTEDVSPLRNELMGPNIEMNKSTCLREGDSAKMTSEIPANGGKQNFNSPVSDGSASFQIMGISSPSTRLPLWKTLEDVSAPDMPVDENNTEEKLALPEDCDQRGENKSSLGEYTDLSDSLLNFSNEDDILFMDADVKDSPNPHSIGSPNVDDTTCLEESKDSPFRSDQYDVDVPSTSVSELDSLQLTEGKIICTLNREDPDIPCNDDIFLLIHPSTSAGLQIATDSLGPLSDAEQGLSTIRKGKDPAPFSAHSLVGSGFKRESPDGQHLVPLCQTALEITGHGVLEEDTHKAEHRGLDSPSMYSEMTLPVKMIDSESMDDSYIYKSDSDEDIPYFSDVEAMILEMDLAHSQESCMTSEVARYQYEGTKRMIIRLEQAARSSFQRAMSSHGALAIFYGRRLKHYIKKTEVTVGRSTDDTEVDIDLRKEGRANKISRRQAIIKMETDGSFNLKNLGATSISLNGKEVAHGQLVALASTCLIEIRGMSFVFEINDKYVKRFLDNQQS